MLFQLVGRVGVRPTGQSAVRAGRCAGVRACVSLMRSKRRHVLMATQRRKEEKKKEKKRLKKEKKKMKKRAKKKKKKARGSSRRGCTGGVRAGGRACGRVILASRRSNACEQAQQIYRHRAHSARLAAMRPIAEEEEEKEKEEFVVFVWLQQRQR